jgi:predicted nucleic acid-binding protein
MDLNKPIYVIDSNVFIKWIYEEVERRAQTLNVINDIASRRISVLVPALCSFEISNFLGRNFNSEEASALFSWYRSLKISEAMVSEELASLAFKIVKKNRAKISFYDASYHALAIQNKAIFVTDDLKYYKQAASFGHIIKLENY